MPEPKPFIAKSKIGLLAIRCIACTGLSLFLFYSAFDRLYAPVGGIDEAAKFWVLLYIIVGFGLMMVAINHARAFWGCIKRKEK
ncbi:MAG: hypothetical protein EPN97_17930 [Alphaproteobacteria bacterium]|nr:MAG: hypothetical protein EPN97_17930 [Alphaproteobacteria bacterium]